MPAQSEDRTSGANLSSILTYIHDGWGSLTRSTGSCESLTDPKLLASAILYLPADWEAPPELDALQRNCRVTIAHLPQPIHQLGVGDVESIQPPGLLYLRNKYVVPGGRFNEMYGWDSYFIIRGLLRDGRIDLARGMVENFFFEIEHYGALLNANRTYYLTRSQPPFLSSMVMAVHDSEKAAGKEDRAWMESAYDYVKRDHAMWMRPPHLAGNTGLSRYYDFGEGPAPEALKDESGVYRQAAAYFLLHPESNGSAPEYSEAKTASPVDASSGAAYSVQVCDAAPAASACEAAHWITLVPDYYKGDRSMRESGFDISFRFGPYGAFTHHYAPVCLNSLLYKTERDLAEMSRLLGKPAESAQWQKSAETRRQSMQKYLWDEREGLFFDYNFESNQRSTYRYATTFYPMWAGLATPRQGRAIVAKLPLFEKPGGIVTSLQQTLGQWDYPYGWAPIQLLAVEGMRRYGYNAQADRVSVEFLSTVLENFLRDGVIREKYNVVARSSETNVQAGYSANVVGFGWTNAAFVELLQALPHEKVALISQTAPTTGAARE